jgi:hypothetical protein
MSIAVGDCALTLDAVVLKEPGLELFVGELYPKTASIHEAESP